MKIAFVANTCWNIFNFRKGLVQHFLSKGDEVLVMTPKDEYTEQVRSWGVTWIETPLNGTGVNPIQDFSYMLQLSRIFRKERPAMVLGFTIKANIYSCLAAWGKTTRVVCNVSGLGTVFLVEGITGSIAKMLYRTAFQSASFVFFQNADDRDLFLSHVRLKQEKVGLLPGSGLNLQDFPYTAPAFRRPTRFLMIARLIVEKGVREFAEAASFFAGNQDITFTLVGRFDESHSRTIAKTELSDWIEKGWLTYLSHSDRIKELINEHEVVVLPSYREGTPRTLLEAAAIGRPLLAANVPGCKEVVVDGRNGFLFELKSAKSIVQKVNLYLSLSEEERMRMSKASRELVVEKFDEAFVIGSYEEVIQQITPST